MEHSVIVRHRETGLYLGGPAGATGDAGAALCFASVAEAERFVAHACEPGALEVVAARRPAAA